MSLEFYFNPDLKNYCFRFQNYWKPGSIHVAELDLNEFRLLFLQMKKSYDEIKPKKEPKLRRLRRIKVK